jgi:predicted XRE-type DNA-binding protein
MLNSSEEDMGRVVHSFQSVWDALADTPEQAASLRARAELMRQITEVIETHGWTQAEAGAKCGVTQPRMNDLLRGRISRFSLDALVNIAAALGRPVRVELQHPSNKRRSTVRRSA